MRTEADLTEMTEFRTPEFVWYGPLDTKKSLSVAIYSKATRRVGLEVLLTRSQALDLWLTLGEALQEIGAIGEGQGPIPAEAATPEPDIALMADGAIHVRKAAPTNGTHAAELAAGSEVAK